MPSEWPRASSRISEAAGATGREEEEVDDDGTEEEEEDEEEEDEEEDEEEHEEEEEEEEEEMPFSILALTTLGRVLCALILFCIASTAGFSYDGRYSGCVKYSFSFCRNSALTCGS